MLVAHLSGILTDGARQIPLPSLPQTLGALVSLSRPCTLIVAQGVGVHCKSSPICFSFVIVALYNACCMRHTSVVLDLLMLGAVPDNRANNLCLTPLLPPLAPFACPAAAP